MDRVQDEERHPPLNSRRVAVEGDLREKNQITVPKAIAEAAGLQAGDRILFVVDDADPSVVHLHRLPESYAGLLAGVYAAADGPSEAATS
jgi:AbrB family looped-hinge helix DNA binding protein